VSNSSSNSSLSGASTMDAHAHGCGLHTPTTATWRHGSRHNMVRVPREEHKHSVRHGDRHRVPPRPRVLHPPHRGDDLVERDGNSRECGGGTVPVGAQLVYAEPTRLRGVQHPRCHLTSARRLQPRETARSYRRHPSTSCRWGSMMTSG
jgi:hypothetical protein